MGQNGSRRFAGDHRTHDVADSQSRRALLFGFALGSDGIRRFAGLADANGQGPGVEDGIAVTEFAAVINFNRQTREALDHELAGKPGMPTGAASDDADLLEGAELLPSDIHIAEINLAGVLGNAAEKRIANGAGLFEDFLLHEMLVAALFRHDGIPCDVVRFALDGIGVVVHDANAFFGKHDDVAVGEEENIASVLEERGNVAGDEIFVVTQADDGWRTETRRDNLLGILGGQKHERVDTTKLLEGTADGFFEGHVALHVLLDEMGDDFGVRFGNKLVALALKLLFQFEVVLDDAVVHDDDLAGAVAMRVSIFFGGPAVSGPARVAYAENAIDRGLGDGFLEVAKFAGGATDLQRTIGSHDGDAGGIVTEIFELAQAFNDDRNNLLPADIANNSAHSGHL